MRRDVRKFRSQVANLSVVPRQTRFTKRNFFVTPMMKHTLKVKLTEAEFAHYPAVVPTPESRKGIAEFPKEIRAAKPCKAELEQRVKATLSDKPMVLVWGMKDPAFGRSFREHWETAFPQETVIHLETAGHYIREDAPEQIVDAIAKAYGPSSG